MTSKVFKAQRFECDSAFQNGDRIQVLTDFSGREDKCIFTKLNAVLYSKRLHEQKNITTVNSVTNT
jgi:hypothetical protein